MIISFSKRIKGKENRLSVSVPKGIVDAYKLFHKQPVSVTLQDRPVDPEMIVKFYTQLSLCGSQGLLIYLSKKDVEKYGLKRDMIVAVKLVTLKEEDLIGI